MFDTQADVKISKVAIFLFVIWHTIDILYKLRSSNYQKFEYMD